MRGFRHGLALLALLSVTSGVRAGLYCRGEEIAELPSQWRGFVLDQRLLRNIAVSSRTGGPAHPARERYQREAQRLAALLQPGKRPTADDLADLGALYVRLGQTPQALDVLRAARRQFPTSFRVVSNLGTAWQVQGDLGQAAFCLREAVERAPAGLRPAEECQLKLVRLRLAHPKSGGLDDLFGTQYAAEDDAYRSGLAASQWRKLPQDAVAIVQRLALWLPADGKLLWQLAELANAQGDLQAAAAMMDGCVSELGMGDPELRRHRQLIRAAVDRQTTEPKASARTDHARHALLTRPRSRRPLVTRVDQDALPAIRTKGVNPLPWWVLGQTVVGSKGRPGFADYLRQLDGKEVTLTGFMQPLDDQEDVAAFLFIEYPIGCWYCEMPEMTSIVSVELPAGRTASYTRSQVKVTGRLQLNATDPESFLYTISNAKVSLTD